MKTQVDILFKGKPYQASLIAPIAHLTFSDKIHQQFAQLDEQIIDVLRYKPACFDPIVLRYQAGGESAKRGVSLTRDRLARQRCVATPDVQAQLINRWIDALEKVTTQMAQMKNFSPSALKGVFHHLLDNKGKPVSVRKTQNWVGGSNIDNATYIPPPAEYLAELLEDLCQFLNRTDLPASLQAAIAYAQFTSIHPLEDGNGRFSRALANSIIKRRLALPVVPPVCLYLMAAGYCDYKETLKHYQCGQTRGFLLMWRQATKWAVARQATLHATLLQFKQATKGIECSSQGSQVFSALITHPVFNLKMLKDKVSLSSGKIMAILEALEKAGISKRYPTPKGEKQSLWCTPMILSALKQFDQESFIALKQNKALHNLQHFPKQGAAHPLQRQPHSQPNVQILKPFSQYLPAPAR